MHTDNAAYVYVISASREYEFCVYTYIYKYRTGGVVDIYVYIYPLSCSYGIETVELARTLAGNRPLSRVVDPTRLSAVQRTTTCPTCGDEPTQRLLSGGE